MCECGPKNANLRNGLTSGDFANIANLLRWNSQYHGELRHITRYDGTSTNDGSPPHLNTR